MNEIETLRVIPLYIFIWVISFLLHEFWHIKGQGWKSTGTIFINKFGMTASCNNIKDVKVYFYSGGVFSSIVLFILCFLITDRILLFCVWSWAWVQLAYGIYEGIKQSGVSDRWYVYGVMILITWLVWWW